MLMYVMNRYKMGQCPLLQVVQLQATDKFLFETLGQKKIWQGFESKHISLKPIQENL